MSKYIIDGSSLTDIGNAIRNKTGETKNYSLDEMAQAIENNEVGVKINGIIEKYIVAAGENINAGDFVSFVNDVSSELTSTNSSACDRNVSAILLSDNKVFISHIWYISASTAHLYGTIVTINGTTMTPTSTKLSDYVSNGYSTSAVLVSDNKIFIAWTYGSSNYYTYGAIVTINGTSMTTTSPTTISQYSYTGSSMSAVLVDSNKVLVTYTYTDNHYLYGALVTISGTTMAVTLTQLSNRSTVFNNGVSAVVLSKNKVFIAHSYSSSLYLDGTIVTISGTSMSANTINLTKLNYSGFRGLSAVLISENKVFISHGYITSIDSSGINYLYGTLVTISGTTMNPISTQLSSDGYGNTAIVGSSVLVNENKVFIAHIGNSYVHGTSVTLNSDNSMSAKTIKLTTTSYDTTPSVVITSDGKIFIAHAYNAKLYGSIYGVVCRCSDGIYGIASQSGSDGDIIDVYIPNVS